MNGVAAVPFGVATHPSYRVIRPAGIVKVARPVLSVLAINMTGVNPFKWRDGTGQPTTTMRAAPAARALAVVTVSVFAFVLNTSASKNSPVAVKLRLYVMSVVPSP